MHNVDGGHGPAYNASPMLRRHRHLPLILAATLLAGQWFAVSHDVEHALQPGAHTCVVCIYTPGAGAGALPSVPALELGGATEAPAEGRLVNPLAEVIRQHPIRGPPALPV